MSVQPTCIDVRLDQLERKLYGLRAFVIAAVVLLAAVLFAIVVIADRGEQRAPAGISVPAERTCYAATRAGISVALAWDAWRDTTNAHERGEVTAEDVAFRARWVTSAEWSLDFLSRRCADLPPTGEATI